MPPNDNPSTPPRPPDPFELWRQIYDTNERAWNAILERTVSNPQFAESSGKILETFLGAQKTVRDNMRQYLEQINLPTREDIARLGELIVALEEKVDQLDDRLARMEGSLDRATRELTSARAAPASTPPPVPSNPAPAHAPAAASASASAPPSRPAASASSPSSSASSSPRPAPPARSSASEKPRQADTAAKRGPHPRSSKE